MELVIIKNKKVVSKQSLDEAIINNYITEEDKFDFEKFNGCTTEITGGGNHIMSLKQFNEYKRLNLLTYIIN